MFVDRRDAGLRLARALAATQVSTLAPSVVLGLPRGGVIVAAEVARRLELPLDVIVVRKLGVPTHPEFAFGAIGEGDVRVIDATTVRRAGLNDDDVARVEHAERRELERRVSTLRSNRPPVALAGHTAIIVDDGIATGATARAACCVARAAGAAAVVLAVPVAPHGWERTIGDAADRYVAMETPRRFAAVGQFYEHFSETTDAEVTAALA